MRAGPSRAFTLIELLSSIAIIAILAAVAVFYVGNYVTTARRTADEQTLETLNDALTRYKTSGGNINALTFGASVGNVLYQLKQPLNWMGLHHQILNSAFTVPARSLLADGAYKTYRFVRYGSYTSPNTALSGDVSSGNGELPSGVGRLTHASGAFALNITSSDGSVAYRVDGGDVEVVASGAFTTSAGSTITFWGSNGGYGVSGDITTVTASANGLTDVNVASLAGLTALDVGNNSISALTLPTSSTLATLYCDQNTLSTLDVSACASINYIDVTSTSITGLATNLNSLYGTLPTLTGDLYLGTGITSAGDTNVATNKGWTIHYNGVTADPPPASGVGIVWHASGSLTIPQITTSTGFFAYQWDSGAIQTMAHGSNKALTGSGSKLTFWSCTSLASSTQSGNVTVMFLNGTNITQIDWRSLVSLTHVDLYNCQSLGAIDLSNHTALTYFRCYGTSLVTIDLSGCSNWSTGGGINGDIGLSPNIVSINISGCSSIQSPMYMYGSHIPWTSLDISGCQKITNLDARNSSLTSLDITNCPELQTINCINNKLSQLDVSQCSKLNTIYCDNNLITGLAIENCPLLSTLSCAGNQITNLNFTNCPGLTSVNVERNPLVSIDLSGHTLMTSFRAGTSNTSATLSINLSGCSGWSSGGINGDIGCLTNIQSINLSGCSSIASPMYMFGSHKSWSAVDIAGCSSLTNLDLRHAIFSSASLNSIYSNLPSHTGTINVTDNPGTTADDPSIATAKGWTVTGS